MTAPDLSGSEHSVPFHDPAAMETLARRWEVNPRVLRRARINFYRHHAAPDETLSLLVSGDDRLAEQLGAVIDFSPLTLDRRTPSRRDEAVKLVFKTRQRFSIETVVLRPKTGRIAVCVSSQIGCAAGCRFCATATMGVARNLSACEVVEQVIHANREVASEQRRVRNIVFMGMGEPMHNAAAITDAIQWLTSPATIDHPRSRILVSTVGVPDRWLAMAEALPGVNYALSLHSAVAKTRERLVPLAKKYSLQQLKQTTEAINAIQRSKATVMIEYVMLSGVNDSDGDAEALLEWIDGLRVHVNLIPFNVIPDCGDLAPSSRETIVRFRDRLHGASIPATIRYSLGADIDAACGQLVRDENRQLARSLVTGNAGAGSSPT